MKTTPIKAGPACPRLRGSLMAASQHLETAGQLLLLQTDADDPSLRALLEMHQTLTALRERVTEAIPNITAAKRHQH